MEKRVSASMNNYDNLKIRMEEYIDIYCTINKDKLRRWRRNVLEQ